MREKLNLKSYGHSTQNKYDVPRFQFNMVSEGTPIMLGTLVKGDIPVYLEFNNSIRKIEDKISTTIYNVQKLLDITDKLLYIDSNGNEHLIKSLKDYIEVV